MTNRNVAPEYIAARRALLDVLNLLHSQRHGLVLVGAQAVYLRAPALDRQQPTFTTDGDLAIDPDLLSEDPDVGALLLESGYERGPNPGAFVSPSGIEIDLMVPEGLLPVSSRRSAPLAGQSRFTARRTPGLELALVDSTEVPIGALEDADPRLIAIRVAGAAALCVAKLIKLEERLDGGRRDRIISKDADDLLRLLRYCDAEAIGARLRELSETPSLAPVIARATEYLRVNLSQRSSTLVALAVEARAPNETDQQVTAAIRILSGRLLANYDGLPS